MRGRLFSTRAEAEAEQLRLDAAAGLPRDHAEGSGPDEYSISTPGAAAARLRARGVRTEHVYEVVRSPDGTAHALIVADDPRSEDLTGAVWTAPPPGAGR